MLTGERSEVGVQHQTNKSLLMTNIIIPKKSERNENTKQIKSFDCQAQHKNKFKDKRKSYNAKRKL